MRVCTAPLPAHLLLHLADKLLLLPPDVLLLLLLAAAARRLLHSLCGRHLTAEFALELPKHSLRICMRKIGLRASEGPGKRPGEGTRTRTPPAPARETKSALRVVLRALRVVGKDGVGLAYPFEPVLRIWGIAAVRVALHCQLPVRLLDLLRARFWRYAQGFVVA